MVSTKRGFLILDDVSKRMTVTKFGPIKCQESWKAKNPPSITFGNHKSKSNLTNLYSWAPSIKTNSVCWLKFFAAFSEVSLISSTNSAIPALFMFCLNSSNVSTLPNSYWLRGRDSNPQPNG